MLARFAYLALAHAFAALPLLPMTNNEKDIEVLALRHQLTVPHRQLSRPTPTTTAGDRTILAALPQSLPRATLRRLRLLLGPDTVLRWHRNLVRNFAIPLTINGGLELSSVGGVINAGGAHRHAPGG